MTANGSLVGISSSPAWRSRARAGPGDNKRAFFAPLCCRLPSRGPFRGAAPGRQKCSTTPRRFTSSGPGIPRHESRRHGMWGMGCGCRQGAWSIHKSLSWRAVRIFRVFWAVLECCRASPLPTRASRNPPRASGTHTLSQRPRVERQAHTLCPNGHGSSFRRANGSSFRRANGICVVRLQVAASSSHVDSVSRTGCCVPNRPSLRQSKIPGENNITFARKPSCWSTGNVISSLKFLCLQLPFPAVQTPPFKPPLPQPA